MLGAPRKALGLGSFLGLPVRQVECKAGSKPDSEAPGCLVLFSGVSGTSRALLKHGAPWVISFDSARSPDEDLMDPERRAVVESLISGGLVAVVSLSPPASSFSRAVTPAVRSRRFPLGVPWLRGEMQANVTRGNDVAAWCSKIVQLCEAHGVEWWLDHPDTSWLWQLRCLKEFASPASPRVWRCDLCFFGAPWRKLRGRSSFGGGAWTALSQPHPKGFFEALAIAAARARKWTEAGGPRLVESSNCRTVPGAAMLALGKPRIRGPGVLFEAQREACLRGRCRPPLRCTTRPGFGRSSLSGAPRRCPTPRLVSLSALFSPPWPSVLLVTGALLRDTP